MNQDPDKDSPPTVEVGSPPGFVAGFVTLLGVPNVGKSTLLNRLLGDKLAIVTPKPQTTRDRILGVLTDERGQMVLVDTPGIHEPHRSLNAYMVREAFSALADTDVAVLVIDAAAADHQGEAAQVERGIAERALGKGVPLVVCLNKVDLLRDKSVLLPLIDQWKHAQAVVPLCAIEGDGLDLLLGEVWPLLPESPPYFDGEALTDRSIRWLAAEAIREQVFLQTRKEVPYAAAVTVDQFIERAERNDTVIEACIHVERESQKGILVGRGGQRIRSLGIGARLSLEALLQQRVHLKLRVAVESEWSRSDAGLRRLGYVP